jgi:hypothetical protein
MWPRKHRLAPIIYIHVSMGRRQHGQTRRCGGSGSGAPTNRAPTEPPANNAPKRTYRFTSKKTAKVERMESILNGMAETTERMKTNKQQPTKVEQRNTPHPSTNNYVQPKPRPPFHKPLLTGPWREVYQDWLVKMPQHAEHVIKHGRDAVTRESAVDFMRSCIPVARMFSTEKKDVFVVLHDADFVRALMMERDAVQKRYDTDVAALRQALTTSISNQHKQQIEKILKGKADDYDARYDELLLSCNNASLLIPVDADEVCQDTDYPFFFVFTKTHRLYIPHEVFTCSTIDDGFKKEMLLALLATRYVAGKAHEGLALEVPILFRHALDVIPKCYVSAPRKTITTTTTSSSSSNNIIVRLSKMLFNRFGATRGGGGKAQGSRIPQTPRRAGLSKRPGAELPGAYRSRHAPKAPARPKAARKKKRTAPFQKHRDRQEGGQEDPRKTQEGGRKEEETNDQGVRRRQARGRLRTEIADVPTTINFDANERGSCDHRLRATTALTTTTTTTTTENMLLPEVLKALPVPQVQHPVLLERPREPPAPDLMMTTVIDLVLLAQLVTMQVVVIRAFVSSVVAAVNRRGGVARVLARALARAPAVATRVAYMTFGVGLARESHTPISDAIVLALVCEGTLAALEWLTSSESAAVVAPAAAAAAAAADSSEVTEVTTVKVGNKDVKVRSHKWRRMFPSASNFVHAVRDAANAGRFANDDDETRPHRRSITLQRVVDVLDRHWDAASFFDFLDERAMLNQWVAVVKQHAGATPRRG